MDIALNRGRICVYLPASGLPLEISIAIAFACCLVLKKVPDTDIDNTIYGERANMST